MNLFEKIEQPIMVIGEKLNNNKALKILRDAFMLAFPMTIFGSIMLIIANFPYLNKLLGDTGLAAVQNALIPASTATMSIATIFICLGIGYYFSKEEDVDPIFGAAISLTAFFLLTPFDAPIGDTGEMLNGVFILIVLVRRECSLECSVHSSLLGYMLKSLRKTGSLKCHHQYRQPFQNHLLL